MGLQGGRSHDCFGGAIRDSGIRPAVCPVRLVRYGYRARRLFPFSRVFVVFQAVRHVIPIDRSSKMPLRWLGRRDC